MSSPTILPTPQVNNSLVCPSRNWKSPHTAATIWLTYDMYRWNATREPDGIGADISSMNAATTALGPQQHIRFSTCKRWVRLDGLTPMGSCRVAFGSFARLLAQTRSIAVWRWPSCSFCNGCGGEDGRPVGAEINQLRALSATVAGFVQRWIFRKFRTPFLCCRMTS